MTALVALSGGVDSSAAACILKEQGYDILGATMRLSDYAADCTAAGRAVAEKLSIPFHIFDFTAEFDKLVLSDFAESYLSGKTPNPCVRCNRFIKWPLMLEKCDELGVDCLVSGHYARLEEKDGKYLLKKGKDKSKDQSYMLYNMTQDMLKRVLFPVGEFTKDEIREIARKNGLFTADKKDSQDICFVPDGDYVSFLESYTQKPLNAGVFVDKNGKILGENKGIAAYTIGQRKGLGIALGKPQFVVEKDAENGRVTLSDEADLFTDTLFAESFNFISGEVPTKPITVTAKTRYSAKEETATVYPPEKDKIKVVFKSPQRAVTSGQSVVFYDGDTLLGGGIII